MDKADEIAKDVSEMKGMIEAATEQVRATAEDVKEAARRTRRARQPSGPFKGDENGTT